MTDYPHFTPEELEALKEKHKHGKKEVYHEPEDIEQKDAYVQKRVEELSTEPLTPDDIQLMSKFGRVKSLNPFRIEYDFMILDRVLTLDEYARFQVLIEKLSNLLQYDFTKPTPEVKTPDPNSFELDTQNGFIDFFTQLLPNKSPSSELATVERSLTQSTETAPAVPNTQVFNSLVQALVAPQTMKYGKFTNQNMTVDVTGNENDIMITCAVKGKQGNKATWTIRNIKNNYRKLNGSNVKLLVYLFQKTVTEPGAYRAYISYDELVEVGIFNSVDAARRGVNCFYDYFHGREATETESYIPRVSIMGNFQTRDRKTLNQEEQDLIIGRKVVEGGQRIDFNPNINMRIFTEYVTFLPLWAYRLKHLDAFLLVQYIFALARQNGEHFTAPEREDQNEAHPYKFFTITIESIRDRLGLPTPENVTGRKYREKIITPIERAIEEIEDEIEHINDPEKSILVTMTPHGTAEAANIEAFLQCTLEVGIIETFAQKFIETANKHEKYLEDFKTRVEKEKAKKAAKRNK